MEPVYHLALKPEWLEALAAGQYDRSTRGMSLEDVGFIHASTSEQLAGTAGRFYADCGENLLVLTIDMAALADAGIDVKYEDIGTGEVFPHIYGRLPVTAVCEVRSAGFDPAGAFEIR